MKVFNLVKFSTEYDIPRKLLNKIVKRISTNHSFKSDIVWNRVCLSLPEDLQKQTHDSRRDVFVSDSKLLGKISNSVSN